MNPLQWLFASRSSTLVARHGLPASALDAVGRAMSAAGYDLVSAPTTAQAGSYRDVAREEKQARFEPKVPPKHAHFVHAVTVRLKDNDTVAVTVGFGPTRKPQVVGGLIALLVTLACFIWSHEIAFVGFLLYYPLAIGIVCLVMPGRTNADATKAVVATIEHALEQERTRAVDSIRRRVDAVADSRVDAAAEPTVAEESPAEAATRSR